MCGLAGFITIEGDPKKTRALDALLIAMESRGAESSGVAVQTDGDTRIVKSVLPASEFILTSSYQKAVGRMPELIMGHTRLATSGKVKEKNAHPFKKGRIIGCHNGMVDNYLAIDKSVRVDSEVIFKLLNEKEPEEALKELSGSFAIAYLDETQAGAINLVRHGNPIYALEVTGENTIFWCSEREALRAILSCFYPLKSLKPVKIKEDKLYTFEVKNGKLKRKQVPVQFGADRVISYAGLGGNETQYSYGGYWDEKDTRAGGSGYGKLKEELRELEELEHTATELRHNRSEREGMRKDGCSFCGVSIKSEELEDGSRSIPVFYVQKDGMPMCEDCFSEDNTHAVVEVTETSSGWADVRVLNADGMPVK